MRQSKFDGPCAKRQLLRRFLIVAGVSAGAAATPAPAQELVHTFINPSFGGNPFYSDHLLGIANLDRPEAPADPTPSPDDLLADQIRSQLNSQASTTILTTIRNAKPGQTGEFTLGDQVISFTRTATETRVTFTNTRTGETRQVTIPVVPTGAAAGSSVILSAERALGAFGASSTGVGRSSSAESVLLGARPPL